MPDTTPEWEVRFTTGVEVLVTVRASDEVEAEEAAAVLAEEALSAAGHSGVRIVGSVDGLPADEVIPRG